MSRPNSSAGGGLAKKGAIGEVVAIWARIARRGLSNDIATNSLRKKVLPDSLATNMHKIEFGGKNLKNSLISDS
jgi:hypothetical protein